MPPIIENQPNKCHKYGKPHDKPFIIFNFPKLFAILMPKRGNKHLRNH